MSLSVSTRGKLGPLANVMSAHFPKRTVRSIMQPTVEYRDTKLETA